MQAELDTGASIAALRRFNDALRAVPADRWGESCELQQGRPSRSPRVLVLAKSRAGVHPRGEGAACA